MATCKKCGKSYNIFATNGGIFSGICDACYGGESSKPIVDELESKKLVVVGGRVERPADFATTKAAPKASPNDTQESPPPSAKPPKPAVQVGLGAFAGGLILFTGIIVFFFQDPGGKAADIAIQALVGKIIIAFGSVLLIGGIFVVFAERHAMKEHSTQTQNPSPEKNRTPNWAYFFVVISLLVVIVGGLIGGLCGLACASNCIWLSRRQDVSLPRRIYGCCISAGMAWILYFVIGGIILSDLHLI